MEEVRMEIKRQHFIGWQKTLNNFQHYSDRSWLWKMMIKHILRRMMGHFKKQLSGDEKQELLEVFDRFKNNLLPLIVPITLMNHYIRKYDESYLINQHYLNPHPVELKLRNHA
ncbi:MAG: YbgA family protein [Desulfobulbaceae bacterium]|nr:YbgA family protein [Desulfobulbaceae bacterium]